jgi:hypothetical protein
MSTKEIVYNIIDKLSEEQLEGLIMLLQGYTANDEAVEPDEYELEMIKNSMADDSEPEPIENFAKRLGIDV